jgi:hypothetical protein
MEAAVRPRILRDQEFRVLAGRAAESAKKVGKTAMKLALNEGGYHGTGTLAVMIAE